MKNQQQADAPSLHVAFDGRLLAGKRAGKGRYVLGLLKGWRASGSPIRLTIYTTGALPFELPREWECVVAPPSILGSVWLARDAKRRGCQQIIAPGNFSLPVVASLPTLTVVYDLAVFRCPEARPSWKTKLAEHLFLKLAASRSVHLFAISQFTIDEALDYLHLSPEKISLAYCGVDEDFRVYQSDHPTDQQKLHTVRARYQLPSTFLLYVGTLEPRKNLVRLFDAYAGLPDDQKRAYPLILVGKIGWSFSEIVDRLTALRDAGWVRHLDYVPDEDIPVLYNLAAGILYPSLYEGFGLPALEAMACGTPVVTTNTSSLPEVVGTAALTVDPYSIEAIRGGIEDLITNEKLRERLKMAGPNQAKKFTWRETAEKIQSVALRLAEASSAGSRP